MELKDQVKVTYEKVKAKTKDFIVTIKDKIKSGELQADIKRIANKVKDTVKEKIDNFNKQDQ